MLIAQSENNTAEICEILPNSNDNTTFLCFRFVLSTIVWDLKT